MLEKIIRWRRELHRIPEGGFHETKTTQYLSRELTLMGYDVHHFDNLDTGVYVYLDYHRDSAVAFRSDIDGLPIPERTTHGFPSDHEGWMHACGHDGHMAALLGFAEALSHNEIEPRANVLLIFEPAEEGPIGGARLIVESGLLAKYNVSEIYGIHLMPSLPEGTMASKAGGLMAECGEIDITIHGKDAHAGLPQEGIDAIVIAAQLINAYQSIVSRMTPPSQPCVLNLGTIHGGSARNSVAKDVTIQGTMRTYSDELFRHHTEVMEKINQGLETAYGCTIDFTCPPLYPPVLNDKTLFDNAKTMGLLEELGEGMMLAEDFAFYQEAVPGLFAFLGTGTAARHAGLHTDTFDFNEAVLLKAVDYYKTLIKL